MAQVLGHVELSSGPHGCSVEELIDVPDNATDGEINAAVREWALEMLEYSWRPATPEAGTRYTYRYEPGAKGRI